MDRGGEEGQEDSRLMSTDPVRALFSPVGWPSVAVLVGEGRSVVYAYQGIIWRNARAEGYSAAG